MNGLIDVSVLAVIIAAAVVIIKKKAQRVKKSGFGCSDCSCCQAKGCSGCRRTAVGRETAGSVKTEKRK